MLYIRRLLLLTIVGAQIFFAPFAHADEPRLPVLIEYGPRSPAIGSTQVWQEIIANTVGGLAYGAMRGKIRDMVLGAFHNPQFKRTAADEPRTRAQVDTIMRQVDAIMKRTGAPLRILTAADVKAAIQYAINQSSAILVPEVMRKNGLNSPKYAGRINTLVGNLRRQFEGCISRSPGPAEAVFCYTEFNRTAALNVGLATTYMMTNESLSTQASLTPANRENLLTCQILDYRSCINQPLRLQSPPSCARREFSAASGTRSSPEVCGFNAGRNTTLAATAQSLHAQVEGKIGPAAAAPIIDQGSTQMRACLSRLNSASGIGSCVETVTNAATRKTILAVVNQNEGFRSAAISDEEKRRIVESAPTQYLACIKNANTTAKKAACENSSRVFVEGQVARALVLANPDLRNNIASQAERERIANEVQKRYVRCAGSSAHTPPECSAQANNYATRQVVLASFIAQVGPELASKADQSLSACCANDRCDAPTLNQCIKGSMEVVARAAAEKELAQAMQKLEVPNKDEFIRREAQIMVDCIHANVLDPRSKEAPAQIAQCEADLKTQAPLDAAREMIDGKLKSSLSAQDLEQLKKDLVDGAFKTCLNGQSDSATIDRCSASLMQEVGVRASRLMIPTAVANALCDKSNPPKCGPETYGMERARFDQMMATLLTANDSCIRAPASNAGMCAINACIKRTIQGATDGLGESEFRRRAAPVIAVQEGGNLEAATEGFSAMLRTCTDEGVDDCSMEPEVYASKILQNKCAKEVPCRVAGQIAADTAKSLKAPLKQIYDDFQDCKANAKSNKRKLEACSTKMSAAVEAILTKYYQAGLEAGVVQCAPDSKSNVDVFAIAVAAIAGAISSDSLDAANSTIDSVSTLLGNNPQADKDAARDAFLTSADSDRLTVNLVRGALSGYNQNLGRSDPEFMLPDRMMNQVLDPQLFNQVFTPEVLQGIKNDALRIVTSSASCQQDTVKLDLENLRNSVLDALLKSPKFKEVLIGTVFQTGIDASVKKSGLTGLFVRVLFPGKINWKKIRQTPQGQQIEAEGFAMMERMARGETITKDELEHIKKEIEQAARATH